MANKYRVTEIQDIANNVLTLSLKWIKRTFDGYCVRLRRSGDDAELDVGFDSNGDVDSATAQAWIDAGGGTQKGHMVTWYDQSGYGNDANQSTPANQPELDLSSTPKIVFLASGLTFLEVTDSKATNVDGGDWTLIMDANLKGFNNQGSSINCVIAKASGQYTNTSWGFILDSFNKMYFKNGASSGTANVSITIAERKTFIGTELSDDVAMYENNVSIATGSSQTGASDNSAGMLIGKALEINRHVDMDLYGLSLYKGLAIDSTYREKFN